MTSKQAIPAQKKRDYVNKPGSHIERRFLADIAAANCLLAVLEGRKQG